MNDSLSRRTARGVFWTGTSQFSVQLFNFLIFIILARLLSPNDFGLVGIVAIFSGFLALFNELGLGAAIIQKADISERHLSSIFWLNLLLGLILFALTVSISSYVAVFYQTPIIESIIKISAIGFLLGPIGTIQSSLLTKWLEFKKLAIITVATQVITGLASVAMAVSGLGVWSLVLAGLIASGPQIVLLWYFCKWRPRFSFDLHACKEVMGFGLATTGTRLVNYCAHNIDYFLVSKFLGASSLGIYTFAFQITTWPLRKISSNITQVTFPIFSTIQDNNERIATGYLKIVRYISVITFPLLMGMIVIAPEFVLVLYGDRWAPAIVPLQIMCLAGLIKSIITCVGSVFMAKGRPDMELKLNIILFLIMAATISIGLNYGLVGVAVAVTVSVCLMAPVFQAIMNRLITIRSRQFISAITPAALVSIIVYIITFIVHEMTSTTGSPKALVLALSILVGTFVFVLSMKLLYKELVKEIISSFKQARL